MMIQEAPSYADILSARDRISGHVHRTPVLTSESINKIIGARLFFKCENFQKVGAFKFRGATNAVLKLTKDKAAKGVATHSSGNHAAALTLAAQVRNIQAYIVMPETAPSIKKVAVEGYGAQITFCKPTLQAREETLLEVIKKTGAEFIHPYDNPDVIAGQGTASLELLEDIPDLDIVMAPVGGGGLLSGTSIAVKHQKASIKVYAGEPANADDAYRSFHSGKFHPSENPKTIADGLLTSLGKITFPVIMEYVDDIFIASEEQIVSAMRLIWERMKIIVEPSSAVPLAAIMQHPEAFRNKRVGIILSGGNVDLSKLPFIQGG